MARRETRASSRSATWIVLPLAVATACTEEELDPRAVAETLEAAAPGSTREAHESWFDEVAQESGLRFEHWSGHGERYLMPEIMGGGAALFDADGDGDLDAYLVQSGSVLHPADSPPNRFFRNRGGGRFEDATDGSGADDRGYGMGVAVGDADGDGDEDLYVTNVGPNVLFLNDGSGAFDDATERAGVGHAGWGTSVCFLDQDRDGRLDLYVTNYIEWSPANEIVCGQSQGEPDYCSPKTYETPARDVFYRNLDGSRFEDRSEPSGVAAELGNGLGVACGDFDDDGWIDVFVANDGTADLLWHNARDGTFENVAGVMGTAVDEDGVEKAGMGIAIGDVDGDLDLDVLVCNLNRESDSFFVNENGYFVDRTSRAGLASISRQFTRFGLGWVDFDHDGRLDLYQANGRVTRVGKRFAEDPYAEPNLLFAGSADGRFEEVSPRGGTNELLVAASRAAVFGDVDDDGDVDVLVVNRDGPAYLLRNRVGSRGNRITFAVSERSGAVALGAVVTLDAGGRRVRRDVHAAYSYLASNDSRVHVGLGGVTVVDDVTVRWADGERESFGRREANRMHALRRGDGTTLD